MYKIFFFICVISESLLCASAASAASGSGNHVSAESPLCFAEMPEDPARHIVFLEELIKAAEINMALLKRNQSFAFSDPAKVILQTLGETGMDPKALEETKLGNATQLYAFILSPYQRLCRELLSCLKSQEKRKYTELLENIVFLYVDFYDSNKKGTDEFKILCSPLLPFLPQIRAPFSNLSSIFREQIGNLFTPFINSESFYFKEALEKKETADRLVGRLKGQFPDASAAQIICDAYGQQLKMLEVSSLCGPEIGAFKRKYEYEVTMLKTLKERERGYVPQQVAIDSGTFSSVIDSYAQAGVGKRSLYPFVMNCGYFLAESLIPFVEFIQAQDVRRIKLQEKRARHIALMASGQRLSLEKIEERRRSSLLRKNDLLRVQLYESIFGVLSGQRQRDDCAKQFRFQEEEEQLRLAVEEEEVLSFAELNGSFFADYPYQLLSYEVEFVHEQKSPQSIRDVRRSLFEKTKLCDVLESLRSGQTVKQPQLVNAIKAFGQLVANGGSEHDIIFWSYAEDGQKITHVIPRFDLRHGGREPEYNSRDLSGRGALVALIKKLREVGYLQEG